MLKIESFPKFELENQNGELITNEKLWRKTILYFYPRDNTPTYNRSM